MFNSYQSPDQTASGHYHTGLLIVEVPSSGRGPIVTSRTAHLVERALSSEGRLRTVSGAPYFKLGPEWRTYQNHFSIATSLCEYVVFITKLEHCPDLFADLNGALGQWNPDERTLLQAVATCGNFRYHGDLPDKFLSQLVAHGERPHVQKADGLLRHPIVGAPFGTWLQNSAPFSPLQGDCAYVHLRALFSALALDPPSHAALYCYLLAAFHARSFDKPRPLLLVDSWIQGVGKTEVCNSICQLVDGQESSVSFRAGGWGEELIKAIHAHIKNRRGVTLDNLDGVKNWNNPFIASACTGVPSVRHLYDSNASSAPGLLLMINLVDGACSIHQDLLARAWRVELKGEAIHLSPSPLEYSKQHTEKIVQEIIYALENSTPFPGASSRTSDFDSVGIAAYSLVFKMAPAEVRRELDAARQNSYAFAHPVLDHFHCFPSQDFNMSTGKLFPNGYSANPAYASKLRLPKEAEGCTLLGHRLLSGVWRTAR